MSAQKIAVFAGSGSLLMQVLANVMDPLIIAFHDNSDPQILAAFENVYWVNLGEVGKILRILKENNISQIVFAGSIKRPNIKTLTMDSVGALWIAKLGLKILGGDNGLLDGICELLQQEGYQIIAPGELVAEIITLNGALTDSKPTLEHLRDINLGKQILTTLSPYDIGQAIIINQGRVLGIEAIEGTAALIQRVADLNQRGVLVKMSKIGQNTKVDLATIGPNTVSCGVNTLFGIALQAGTTQILEYGETIKFANQKRMFIYGF